MPKQWYNLRAQGDGVAELLIYTDIGESWWGESLSAKDFSEQLKELGDLSLINVRINSPGGSVFDGLAMMNLLVHHQAQVHVYIDGIAASIASVIAMAGDKVIMGDSAMFMIHNPWSCAWGESKDMRKMADTLDKIKESLCAAYERRVNLERDALSELMDQETWLSADEAIAMGLADEKTESLAAAAMKFDLSGFSNVPRGLNPAASSSKRKEPTMPKRNRSARNGEQLAATVEERISELVTDERTRDDIIAEMAEAAGIEVADVEMILTGETACPTMEVLEAVAPVLDMDSGDLVTAAEADGCDYSGGEEEEGGETGGEDPADKAPLAVAKLTSEQAYAAGARAERERIQTVEDQLLPGHEDLIAQLKFDGKTSGPEAAAKVLAAERGARGTQLANRRGAARPAPAAPAPLDRGGKHASEQDDLPLEERAKAKWDADPQLRKEFGGDFEAFKAFENASGQGLVKVMRK